MRYFFSSVFLMTIWTTACAANALGQATAAPVSPGSVQAADSAPTVKTGANLVLVDVVVTSHGEAQHGLGKGHFRVLQDGREQAIVSFEEHAPAAAAPVLPKALNLPPHTWTNIPNSPPSTAVNVLLLDALNTPIGSQMQVRVRMLDYLGKLTPGTPLAVFTLTSRLRMLSGFTGDPAELVKALKGGKGMLQTSSLLGTETGNDTDAIVGDMATSGANPDALAGMQQFLADVTAFQTDQRVRMTLDAMQQLGRYLNGIPGRKNLIWFSGSFPIELAPDGSLDDPFEAMRNYAEDIEQTSELLSGARVAVYPIDARGLLLPPVGDVTTTTSTNLMGGTTNGGRGGKRQAVTANKPSVANNDTKFMQETMAEAASMKQLAEATGGQDYLNTNGFQEAVGDAIENGASYYTIGYVPDPKRLDGRFHKIDVKVDFDGPKLAYRRGYFARSAGQGAANPSLIAMATLHGAPPATEILFTARVLPASDAMFKTVKLPDGGPAGEDVAALKGTLFKQIVDLTIDPRGISFEEGADGVHRAQVEFVLVAYDGEGRRVNHLDRGFQLGMKEAQYEKTMASALPIRMALDLPVGRYWLRVAVHDLGAGRAGSLEAPVKVGAE